MDESPQVSLRLLLTREEGAGRVAVELQSYVEFNRWINVELDKLEKHFAAFQTPGVPKGRRGLKSKKPK